MNPDLILLEDDCSTLGHEWLALEDMYGTEIAECERCGVLMGETGRVFPHRFHKTALSGNREEKS